MRVRVRVSVRVRVRVTVRLRVTERVREMGTAFYQIYMCKEPMAASPHHRQMAENEPLGDSNHRPSAYKAVSLSIRVWLRCSKWAEFGTYHTARRLVKGKEKLKRVSCTQKNGLELVHPERVRHGEAQNGGLGEKNVSQRKTVFQSLRSP